MLAAAAIACNAEETQPSLNQPQLSATTTTVSSSPVASALLSKLSELLARSASRLLLRPRASRRRQLADTSTGEGGGGGVGGGGGGAPKGDGDMGNDAPEGPAEGDAAAGGSDGGDSERSPNDVGQGGGDEPPEGLDNSEDAATAAAAETTKRRLAIYEIVDSEESYVNKLRFIAEKYIPLKDDPDAALPPDLGEKWSIVWGNWWRLLEGHVEILAKLKSAFETDMDSVAGVFIAKERHMSSWYSKYCENHRKAQHIACEQHRDFFEQVRLNLRDKEDMNSHLMNPVQRCMRYSLLVGTVIEKARKDGLDGQAMSDWERMRNIMRELPQKTESIMEASRIDNLESGIRVTALGQVRIKGMLRLCVLPGAYNPGGNPPPSQLKFEQRKVFLFDQMMLVTEVKRSGKGKSTDQFSNLQTIYIYRSKVKMNNMRHFSTYKYASASGGGEESDTSGQLFCVCDTQPGANVVYVFDPAETDTRAQWVAELRQMEKQQTDFLKILQNPVMMGTGGAEQIAGGAGAGPDFGAGRKSVKDKEKSKTEPKKKSKLSFMSRSRKSTTRSGTDVLPRGPQSSKDQQKQQQRKNSCPDVTEVAAVAAAATAAAAVVADQCSASSASASASASSSSGHHHHHHHGRGGGRSGGKELRKIPSEGGSSGSYDTENSQQQQQPSGPGIVKKKSGINFNSLQSFFSNKKNKSRSESKLNPTT